MDKVAIVIVTYNRLKLLQEEIDSLRLQTYKDFRIIVVNNGSTDGTLQWLEKQKDIQAITQENLGGAGGFYTGMKYAAENGYDYVWVMDDDVECSSNALEELMKISCNTPEMGFLCSRVFAADKKTLMNVPVIDDMIIDGEYERWLERVDEKLIRVKKATFVSILIPTKHIFELGLPIKEYFIWGDDLEYTNRISRKYASYLVCNSIVFHRRMIAKSLNFMTEKDPKRIKNYYYSLRNNLLNQKKYGKTKDVVIAICYLFSIFVRSIIHLDFTRMKVVVRAFFSALFFKEIISYPLRS